jgi:hypothetical protein
MPRPPAYKRYTCVHGPLTLFVRETCEPNTLEVRVTHKPKARIFEQALVIRPGTVLCLRTSRRGVKYVRVQVFNPRIQYGRLVAGGTLRVHSTPGITELEAPPYQRRPFRRQ